MFSFITSSSLQRTTPYSSQNRRTLLAVGLDRKIPASISLQGYILPIYDFSTISRCSDAVRWRWIRVVSMSRVPSGQQGEQYRWIIQGSSLRNDDGNNEDKWPLWGIPYFTPYCLSCVEIPRVVICLPNLFRKIYPLLIPSASSHARASFCRFFGV